MIAHTQKWVAAGIFYVACAGMTQADDQAPHNNNDSPWSLEFEMGIENEPAYTGSDVYLTEPSLNVELAYEGRGGHTYFVSLGELGIDWALGEQRSLSTLLEYEFGRDNADDSALTEFPVFKNTVEVQAVYRQQFGNTGLGIGIQYDVLDRGKGLVGFIGVDYRRMVNPRFALQAQIDLSFADAEHMQTEVGISPGTAESTGLNAYEAASGYKGASVGLGLQYAVTNRWMLKAQIALEHYGSIMADSPLIRDEGSATNVETGIGVSYEFW